MRTVTLIKLGTLALGIVLAAPAFAQEVWQTYPFTISTPAFGPGPVTPYRAPPARRAARPLYNVVPSAPGALPSPANEPGNTGGGSYGYNSTLLNNQW